ncbi:MAG: amidohydrolase family protein [Myxococcota bacterium]|nr:amidohydrolase family protein [Myxococcota bacterium]
MLHLDPPRVERADIHVEGGRVVELVSPDGPAVAETRADENVVDATGCWVMPGLVCGHHHLYSALACGMPLLSEPPTSFADMLAKVWWRLDEALDAESVLVSGLVGGLGALRSGVTTIVDHHASPSFIEGSLEVLDEALESVGVRRVLCYEVTDRGGPEHEVHRHARPSRSVVGPL